MFHCNMRCNAFVRFLTSLSNMLKTDFTVKSIVGTQDLEWEEPLPNSPEATRILGAAEEHMSVTIYFCFFL